MEEQVTTQKIEKEGPDLAFGYAASGELIWSLESSHSLEGLPPDEPRDSHQWLWSPCDGQRPQWFQSFSAAVAHAMAQEYTTADD